MRKTILIFIWVVLPICIGALAGQSCLLPGLTINYQGEVNNFSADHPGCHVINGDLHIQGPYLSSLDGLATIDTVTGYVYITSTGGALTTLHGLENIRYMGGLRLENNVGITNLTGLEGLEHISGYLSVLSNQGLQSLNGLQNLKSLGGFFVHEGNNLLSDISALSNITSLEQGLHISGSVLTNLNGLQNIKSVVEGVYIESNPFLESIDLHALDSIAWDFKVVDNPLLTTLSGLNHLANIGGYELTITDNPLLESCAIPAICNALQSQHIPQITIAGNAPGCNSKQEVQVTCGANPLPVIVTVLADIGGDCSVDSTDIPAGGIMVTLNSQLLTVSHPSGADGIAHFMIYDTTPFFLTLPNYPSLIWEVCQDTITVNPGSVADTLRVTFLLKPVNNSCPLVNTELNLPPFFRGCIPVSSIRVTNHNAGGVIAENTKLAVIIPDELVVISTNPSAIMTSGDTLFFDTGDLLPFQTATVNIQVHTDCSLFLQGRTLCLESMSYVENSCGNAINGPTEVRLSSQCIGDTTVRFTLKNIQDGFMQNTHQYIIIEDEIVLRGNTFNLGPLGTMDVEVPANGATYRMEATRFEDGTLIATANEGCGGLSPGLITNFWLNNRPSDYDYDCREMRVAFDPNEKTAVPTGIGMHHQLPANQSITYTIEFQNTGTDTAFRVLLRDVLSPDLDVTSFRPGGSSHPFTWEIRGRDTLEVLFLPIVLPDSTTNEPESRGWMSFTIDQKPNLTNGTIIRNTASIIFDYNPPIITNTTFHTIGITKRSRDRDTQNELLTTKTWRVLNNPMVNSAIFLTDVICPGKKQFTLFNATGNLVSSEFFSGQQFEFKRETLASGIYDFTIIDQLGRVFGGKLMVR